MAMIGYLGKDADNGILFTVSREVFLTPTGITWGGSARYATHERHNTHALTEFTGLNPDSFSFDILLTAELGVNPLDEVVKIWGYERDGEALGLVIGGKAYGKYRWNITKHEIKIKYTDAAGDMYAVEVSLSIQEYLKGEDHNTSAAQPAATAPAPTTTGTPGASASLAVGDKVYVNATKHYVSSNGDVGYSCKPGWATITIIAPGAKHPYHVIHTDRSSNLYGWVNEADIQGGQGGSGSGERTYTVKKGDCIWNIAKTFYGSGAQYMKIYEANRGVIGSNPALIYPGQVLVIP